MLKTIVILLIGLLIIIAGIAAYAYVTLKKPQFTVTAPVEIYLKPGSGFQEIVGILKSNKLLRNETLFKIYMIASGKHKRIKAGYYLFDKPLSVIEFSDKLLQGQAVYVRVTIPEGSNLYDIEPILIRNGLLEKIDYSNLLTSEQLLHEVSKIDADIKSLEGYLFPETYFLPKGETALTLLKMMIKEFKKKNLEKLKTRASEMATSVNALVIMASLIEKESGYTQERPLIASVFYNRLKIGMRLQCDPTVLYSFYVTGKFPATLTREDLEIDSPYNTYRYAGLPPAPICNPGNNSLLAAMYPEASNYLYFVSKGNGTHYFSKNLSEHIMAISRYQK